VDSSHPASLAVTPKAPSVVSPKFDSGGFRVSNAFPEAEGRAGAVRRGGRSAGRSPANRPNHAPNRGRTPHRPDGLASGRAPAADGWAKGDPGPAGRGHRQCRRLMRETAAAEFGGIIEPRSRRRFQARRRDRAGPPRGIAAPIPPLASRYKLTTDLADESPRGGAGQCGSRPFGRPQGAGIASVRGREPAPAAPASAGARPAENTSQSQPSM